MNKFILLLIFSCSLSFAFSTTDTVTNTNDSGAGSLRAVMASASSGDTIRFSPSLIAGGSDTILLISALPSTKSLIYKGIYNSTDTLFISGDSLVSIFDLDGATGGINNYFDSVVLINGAAGISGSGGAIKSVSLFYSSEITINNSVLRGNSSYQGGAIYLQSTYSYVNLTILNSKVVNNNASGSGGGMVCFTSRANSVIKISNSDISNNSTGGSGGGLISSCGSNNNGDFSKVEIRNSTFNNNSSRRTGGAVSSSASSNSSSTKSIVFIDNSSFTNNSNSSTSSGGGGAIYSNSSHSSSDLTIQNSSITNNSGGVWGGGISCWSDRDTNKIKIYNSKINNNVSKYGAGIHASTNSSSGSYTKILVNNSEISFNTCTNRGGGIHADNKSTSSARSHSKIDINNSKIIGNNAQSGAGIYSFSNSSSSFVTISNSTLSKNIASYVAGGIYSSGVCSSTVKYAESNVKILHSTLDSNSGAYGGGVYSRASLYTGNSLSTAKSIVDISYSTITSNTSTNDGGGILSTSENYYMIDSSISQVNVLNSTFVDNNAVRNGGTIYCSSADASISNYFDSKVDFKSSILLSLDTSFIYNSGLIKINSGGNNLFSDTGIVGLVLSDSVNVSPSQVNLAPYSLFNGGFTKTRMPIPPSIAIDGGNPTDISDAQNRPVIGVRDVGATENNCQQSKLDTIITSASYFWKGTLHDTSGTFMLTEINPMGCDTIFTLVLIIDTNGTLTKTICANSFTWFGKTYLASGTYYQPLSTTPCCSGFDTLNLTLNVLTYTTLYDTSCGNYVSPSGLIYYSSGTYTDVIPNSTGCDSVITINLLVDTIGTRAISSCEPFVWYGKTYATTGVYYQSISGAGGCGTMDTLTLTVTTIDTTVSINGYIMTSNDATTTYQWRNCVLLWPEFNGSSRNYQALYNGKYTVYLSKNGCVSNPVCIGHYPTTLYVINKKDNGYGSLRFVVDNAKPGDTIRFADSLIIGGSDTINLLSTIKINKEVTIVGLYNSSDTLFISGNSSFPVLSADLHGLSKKDLWIDSLSIIDGNSAGNTNIYILNNGGAIYFDGDTISIKNSLFRNNSSPRDAGAIYSKGKYMEISGSKFENNIAASKGGAIKTDQVTHLMKIEDSKFYGNSANQGGAIYCYSYLSSSISSSSYSRIQFSNSELINNSSILEGGGIFLYSRRSVGTSYVNTRNIYSNTRITFDNSIISNNIAGKDGGAVYSYAYGLGKSAVSGTPNTYSEIIANKCTIKNNRSNRHGGAFYSFSDSYTGNLNVASVLIDSCMIMNNEAIGSGGVIYSLSDAWAAPGYSKVGIKNTVLKFNKANQNGGAIFNNDTRVSQTLAENSFFYKNHAINNGGAINTGDFVSNNSTFEDNESLFNGGAVFAVDMATIKNSIFNKNKGTNGGAFASNQYYDLVKIDSSYFTNNYASNKGGACQMPSNGKINHSIFQNNEAIKKGGAIYVYKLKELEIFSSTLNNNKAQEGGAISSDSTSGYVYSTIKKLTVNRSTITENEANVQGGGIHMADKYEKLKVLNSTISHNKAIVKGNGVFCKSDSLEVYSSIISLNKDSNNIENLSNSTVSYGYNLIGDDTFLNRVLSDSLHADSSVILLGVLTNNGGFTKTRMPLIGSYAVDNGDITDLSDGQNRPLKATRDIGAAEGNCQLFKSDTIITCSNIAWRNKVYSISGDYSDFSFKTIGCDSIYRLHLIIDTAGSGNVVACENYTWYGKNYTSSGTYFQTLSAGSFCNTADTLQLTILRSTYNSVNISTCNSYVSSSGRLYSTNGIYQDTLVNSIGCDSVITINLTINLPSSTLTNVTACNKYYFASNGKTYSSSGVYKDTLLNSSGCDSITAINLTIVPLTNNFVSKTSSNTLESLLTGVTYQWVDCNNGYTVLTGETSKVFTAVNNGSYAVVVAKNGCTDTSSCFSIMFVGTNENSKNGNITVYPNPSSGIVNIDFSQIKGVKNIQLTDLSGKLIYEEDNIVKDNFRMNFSKTLASGIYNLKVKTEKESKTIKLILK